MIYATALRRAARWNPAKGILLYRPILDDDGNRVFDAAGKAHLELGERTWGALDLARDETPTGLRDYDVLHQQRLYQGDAILTVITAMAVTDAWAVVFHGTPYQVKGVHSADAWRATLRLEVNAITPDEMNELVAGGWPDGQSSSPPWRLQTGPEF